MTIKTTMRSLAAGALMLGATALSTSTRAAEIAFPKVQPTLDERVVVENHCGPLTQSLFRYNQNRAIVETTPVRNAYGLNH